MTYCESTLGLLVLHCTYLNTYHWLTLFFFLQGQQPLIVEERGRGQLSCPTQRGQDKSPSERVQFNSCMWHTPQYLQELEYTHSHRCRWRVWKASCLGATCCARTATTSISSAERKTLLQKQVRQLALQVSWIFYASIYSNNLGITDLSKTYTIFIIMRKLLNNKFKNF